MLARTALTLILSLTACTARDPIPNESEEMIAAVENPSYGPRKRITGKALFGQETVIIGLCRAERSRCSVPTDANGSEQSCWLVFTDAGAESLIRVTGRRYQEDGEYSIEGEGRVADSPGGFGHLSQYSCQVEIHNVRVFEEGPPWMWAPPPP